MIRNAFLFCLCLSLGTVQAQNEAFTTSLYDTYETYKEPSLDKRRIKHTDLQPLIAKWKQDPNTEVNRVGTSIEGRSLQLISMGNGPTDVFLWSQMHGNEPTATQAIFDILNFFAGTSFEEEKSEILSRLRVHFLPMLNPDGAEVFQRRNTLGIDINRDALRLQSPEGQTLKRVRDSVDADFGFNLHDQSTYYNAERTEKPATISYLAPAYNYEKEINEKRGAAMQVIVFMNNIIQKYAPGQVGRYNDDFEPRAFGDNIQKWGTSTILIESGGYPSDAEKQEIRKLNYVSILSALYTIAKENYKDIPIADYEKIPENDRKLFDLKLEKVTYPLLGKEYVMDIGIHRLEVDLEGNSDFWYSSRIIDQGDLSTYYGYETFNAEGYKVIPGKVYPKVLSKVKDMDGEEYLHNLKQGYLYFRIAESLEGLPFTPGPFHLINDDYKIPELRLEVGRNPTFLLEKDGKADYAVVNGFLIDLSQSEKQIEHLLESTKINAMIYR
ncbi:MAG: peptidase M14 [Eudoraea sp.]|nr:peptidase M14 [Eudoraea sp.]